MTESVLPVAPLQANGKHKKPGVRIRTVALPIEHGAWGFLLEPILLGLLTAPSWSGVFLGIATLGIFLINHPLKIMIKDYLRRKRYPRTAIAERFVLLYGIVSVTAGILTLATAQGSFLMPIILAIPFALTQIILASLNRGRTALAEVGGAVALAAAATAIPMVAGWSFEQAWVYWLILAARDLSSIIYVRVRLRRARGEDFSSVTPMRVTMINVGLYILLVILVVARPPLLIAAAILLIRAQYGLSDQVRHQPAKVIGMIELGVGLWVVLFAAL